MIVKNRPLERAIATGRQVEASRWHRCPMMVAEAIRLPGTDDEAEVAICLERDWRLGEYNSSRMANRNRELLHSVESAHVK